MADSPISRGFRARRSPEAQRDRVPPGQHVVADFPVLSAGPTPAIELSAWRFALEYDGKLVKEWNWETFNALPQSEFKSDIHCVTTWSKFDTQWKGVTIDTLLQVTGFAEPPAPFILAHCAGDYSTNLPSKDVSGGKAMIATSYEGEAIEPEHGGPARLLVPHLYFWKSAKWINRIQFVERDTPGLDRKSVV